MTKEFSSGAGGPQPHVHYHTPRPSAATMTAGPQHPHHHCLGLGPRARGPSTVAFLRPAAFLGSDFVPLSASPKYPPAVVRMTCPVNQAGPARQKSGVQLQQSRPHDGSCTTPGTGQQIPSFGGFDLAPSFLEELLRHGLCKVDGRLGSRHPGSCNKGRNSCESPDCRSHSPWSTSSDVTCCKGKESSCEDKVEGPAEHSVNSKQEDHKLSFAVQPDASKGESPQPLLQQGHSGDLHSFSPCRNRDEDSTTWVHSIHGLGIFHPGEVAVKVKAGRVVVHVRREKSHGPGPCLSRLEMVKAIPLPDNVEQQSLRCVLKADGTLQLTGHCRCPTTVDRKSDGECGLQNQQEVKKDSERADNEEETSQPQCREMTKPETFEEQVPKAKEADGDNRGKETHIPIGPESAENEQDGCTDKDAVSVAFEVKPLAELASKSVSETTLDSSPPTTIAYEHVPVMGEESDDEEIKLLAHGIQDPAIKRMSAEGTTVGEVEKAEAQSPIVQFPDDEDVESENELELARSSISQSSVASDLEVIGDLFDGCIEKDLQGTGSHDDEREAELIQREITEVFENWDEREESEQTQRKITDVFEDCDATPPLKRQSVSKCDNPRSGTPVDCKGAEDELQYSACNPRSNTPVDSKSCEDELQQSGYDSTTPEVGKNTPEKEYQRDSATDVESAGDDKLQKLEHGRNSAGSQHPNGAFRFSLPVMGFSLEDMQVKLKGRTLKFHAWRHAVVGDAPYTEGLERVIELPVYLDTNTVQCHLGKDGYLVITALPKLDNV